MHILCLEVLKNVVFEEVQQKKEMNDDATAELCVVVARSPLTAFESVCQI